MINKVKSRNELADLLGISRKRLTYLLYIKHLENMYTSFEILILSILVDTFISKISLPMQPVPEIRSISGA